MLQFQRFENSKLPFDDELDERQKQSKFLAFSSNQFYFLVCDSSHFENLKLTKITSLHIFYTVVDVVFNLFKISVVKYELLHTAMLHFDKTLKIT